MRKFRAMLACLSLLWFAALSPEAVRSLQAGAQQPAPAAQAQPAAAAAPATPATPAGELVNRYCVTCHNKKLAVNGTNADLHLDEADQVNIGNSAEVWEKVIVKLRMKAMPPPGNRRPDSDTYAKVVSYLETELDKAAAARPDPGQLGMHRLNRVEYANSVRDLLGIEIDATQWLPPDDQAFGFDTNADALSTTPALMDRYLAAAAKIGRMAVGDPTIRPTVERYTAVPNNPNDRTFMWQNDRQGEEFPLGSRGGIAVRHNFPVDGEYIIRIRPDLTYQGDVRGIGTRNDLEIRVDGVKVGQFAIGGAGTTTNTGGTLAVDDLRIEEMGLESRIPIKAGTHLVTASLLKTNAVRPEGLGPDYMPIWTHTYDGDAGAPMLVSAVFIAGPYNGTVPQTSPSRERLYVCRPTSASAETACATRILSTLARRAYRRPVTTKDTATLLDFYKKGRTTGDFDAGIRAALERVLASPDFLFRIEREPAGVKPGTNYRVSDVEMASRLSFFLWSSGPDDQLLDIAQKGQLKDPKIFDAQVRRMLADPRGKQALVDNFFAQWLQTRNVWLITPDLNERFPWFDDNLRIAFVKEMEMFLGAQLGEDRSVIDLLTSNETFLNEQLAKFYNVPNVYGSHFRRVTLSDENRFGLLGKAAVLSVASTYPNRTSPTLRGKWLLENILAAPMPPPPANVNAEAITQATAEARKTGKAITIREMLETHRKNPTCASCHNRMDPLGLGLENFNAIGQWRTTDAGIPINATGVLLDGSKFEGPAQLRAALVASKENFLTAVTQKLLTYGLGRHVEYYDAPSIRGILREASKNDYKWSSMILSIVKSTPFQMRRSRS
jgi:mono/diheme cytochrome c family protein